MALTWRDVTAPSLEGAVNSFQRSAAQAGGAFTGLSDGLAQWNQARTDRADTAAIQAANQITDSGQYAKALADGSILGNAGIDPNHVSARVSEMMGARQKDLLAQDYQRKQADYIGAQINDMDADNKLEAEKFENLKINDKLNRDKTRQEMRGTDFNYQTGLYNQALGIWQKERNDKLSQAAQYFKGNLVTEADFRRSAPSMGLNPQDTEAVIAAIGPENFLEVDPDMPSAPADLSALRGAWAYSPEPNQAAFFNQNANQPLSQQLGGYGAPSGSGNGSDYAPVSYAQAKASGHTGWAAVYGNGQFGVPDRPVNAMTIGESMDAGVTQIHRTKNKLKDKDGNILRDANGNPLGTSANGGFQITKDTKANYAPKVFGEGWENVEYNFTNQMKLAKAIFADNKDRLDKVWTSLTPEEAKQLSKMSFEDAADTILRKESGTTVAAGEREQQAAYEYVDPNRPGGVSLNPAGRVDLNARIKAESNTLTGIDKRAGVTANYGSVLKNSTFDNLVPDASALTKAMQTIGDGWDVTDELMKSSKSALGDLDRDEVRDEMDSLVSTANSLGVNLTYPAAAIILKASLKRDQFSTAGAGDFLGLSDRTIDSGKVDRILSMLGGEGLIKSQQGMDAAEGIVKQRDDAYANYQAEVKKLSDIQAKLNRGINYEPSAVQTAVARMERAKAKFEGADGNLRNLAEARLNEMVAKNAKPDLIVTPEDGHKSKAVKGGYNYTTTQGGKSPAQLLQEDVANRAKRVAPLNEQGIPTSLAQNAQNIPQGVSTTEISSDAALANSFRPNEFPRANVDTKYRGDAVPMPSGRTLENEINIYQRQYQLTRQQAEAAVLDKYTKRVDKLGLEGAQRDIDNYERVMENLGARSGNYPKQSITTQQQRQIDSTGPYPLPRGQALQNEVTINERVFGNTPEQARQAVETKYAKQADKLGGVESLRRIENQEKLMTKLGFRKTASVADASKQLVNSLKPRAKDTKKERNNKEKVAVMLKKLQGNTDMSQDDAIQTLLRSISTKGIGESTQFAQAAEALSKLK